VIQSALAADSLEGVPVAAKALVDAAKSSEGAIPESAVSQAEDVAKASDLEAARAAFKPLSDTMISALVARDEESGQYYEAFCPTADAAWIQAGKEVANPYYGASMLQCGTIRKGL